MKKPPLVAAHPARIITVLCVDPSETDFAPLEEIFNSSPWSLCPDALWTLQISSSFKSAWRLLRLQQFPLVLCDGDLRPGTWRELLDLTCLLPEPPCLIVTSRAADERLWAEAINLGAYDVLAKPFDSTEVTRVVCSAWRHWSQRHEMAARAALAAAGEAV